MSVSEFRNSGEVFTRRGMLKLQFAAAMLLCLFITTTVLAAGRCVPCKQNHYCQGGLRFQCPAERPVTQAMGAATLDECMTCVERDGSGKPVFDDLMGTDGDCVSCDAYSSETPIWNGTACVSCATSNSATPVWSGTTCTSCYTANANTPYWDTTTLTCTACPTDTDWNEEKVRCISTLPCQYEIPHGNGTLCLVESVPYITFSSVSPQSAEEETAEFLAKYGIVDVSDYYPDNWAGAMKYCQDKGLRLPTMDELVSIMNVVYGTSNTCTLTCGGTSSDKTGCCSYSSLSVANQSLRNFLGSGSSETSVTSALFLWSSAVYSSYIAYYRGFTTSDSSCDNDGNRDNYYPRALCVR